MISSEVWWLFVGYTVPMVFSPGPGNTVLATAGGRFGIRGSLPFWMGFEVANLALCVIYGLGLARVLHHLPLLHQTLRWGGVVYLLYLAWSFFRSSATPGGAHEDPTRLGFGEGFLAVALNPKIHSMIVVMFSQFIDPTTAMFVQTAQLTAAFLVICVVCHFPWIYGGKLILGRFHTERAMRIQGWAFGTCMLVVAGYVALV
jgi:homoserine/homoserine lactone efflux protein